MGKYMLFLMILLFSCDDKSTNSQSRTDIQLIGYRYKYDITATQGYVKKPFAQKSNDTLIITDYWAMIEQPDMIVNSECKGDTLVISYDQFVPSTSKDWTPTVEVTSKFLIKSAPNTIILKIILNTSVSRQPSTSEQDFGIRNASQPCITSIKLDSI